MQVCNEKLGILDEYLVDHCWMVTPDHHLENRLSLSHVSRRRRRRRPPRVRAKNEFLEPGLKKMVTECQCYFGLYSVAKWRGQTSMDKLSKNNFI